MPRSLEHKVTGEQHQVYGTELVLENLLQVLEKELLNGRLPDLLRSYVQICQVEPIDCGHWFTHMVLRWMPSSGFRPTAVKK
jgi:hypothetical protein